MGIQSRNFALCMPIFRLKTQTPKHQLIQPKACISWRANRNPLNLAE
jgi:hypothetical protein